MLAFIRLLRALNQLPPLKQHLGHNLKTHRAQGLEEFIIHKHKT